MSRYNLHVCLPDASFCQRSCATFWLSPPLTPSTTLVNVRKAADLPSGEVGGRRGQVTVLLLGSQRICHGRCPHMGRRGRVSSDIFDLLAFIINDWVDGLQATHVIRTCFYLHCLSFVSLLVPNWSIQDNFAETLSSRERGKCLGQVFESKLLVNYWFDFA